MSTFDIDYGQFVEPDNHYHISEAFDNLLEAREGRRISETQYISKLKSFIERHTDFIDAYSHLGFALLRARKSKAALEVCETGLAKAISMIPAGYDGPIEWGWLENRPFLRVAHATVLSCLAQNQRSKAIELMERILEWNPDDNQGIRFIIGSELLRDDKPDLAQIWLEKCADEYPPYRYELGLLHFRAKNYAEAATSFRHGFLENGYIAEILMGSAHPFPLIMWHGSNYDEPDYAKDYVDRHGALWFKTADALSFLRWLYMHPVALRERANSFECRQALLWKESMNEHGAILDQLDKVSASITVASSAELVRQLAKKGKKVIYPWMREVVQ